MRGHKMAVIRRSSRICAVGAAKLQARLKETDRIMTMATELRKMGAAVEERPDGLVVRQRRLKASEHKKDLERAVVSGWIDHGEAPAIFGALRERHRPCEVAMGDGTTRRL